MAFDSGSLAFARFAVAGDAPTLPDEDALENLRVKAFDDDQMSAHVEQAVGWCGGRHVYDADFGFEHNVFNDCVAFALRSDTNKVPADVRRAYAAQEEVAAGKGNPSGLATKQQKKDAKETAGNRVLADLESGRFRRSRMTPLLWDLPNFTVYGPASAKAAQQVAELFERTHDDKLSLLPLTSGTMALRRLEAHGRRRDYEDLQPTPFVIPQQLAAMPAEYPWAAKGDQHKDFLGSEFLLWLWHAADTEQGAATKDGVEVQVMVRSVLDLDCAWGATGRGTLRAEGPGAMPEAAEALRSGKVPRKVGLAFAAHGNVYSFALDGPSLAVSGLKLPEIEDADSARVVFEERITHLRDFCGVLDGLFDAFLDARCGGGWMSGPVAEVRRWAAKQTVGGGPRLVEPPQRLSA